MAFNGIGYNLTCLLGGYKVGVIPHDYLIAHTVQFQPFQ